MSRAGFVVLLLVGLLGAFVATSPAAASDPASSEVTVPASPGETAPQTWTGTVGAPDAHLTSNCTEPPDGGATHDQHALNLAVPSLGPDLTYEVYIAVVWEPVSGEHRPNDLMFTVLDGEGAVVVNVDSASTKEEVLLPELPAGEYTIEVCAFDNVMEQPYDGQVLARTKTVDSTALPVAAPDQGLGFSASVPADIQRDEGEPLIHIDGNGRTYTCGPTGFSQANEYIQVSTDGGDQFHLLGEPPRGQWSLGGGGDCALATSPSENEGGFHHLGYVGLSGLLEFATTVSDDGGHSFEMEAFSGTGAAVDRQWITSSSDARFFLNFNRVEPTRQTEVCTSTDGGRTYPSCQVVAPDPLFPGPMKTIMPEDHDLSDEPLVYFPWTDTADDSHPNMVLLAISIDDGQTWNNCRIAVSQGEPGQSFAVADHDADGEAIYVVWTDRADFNTYMSTVRVADLAKCTGGLDPAEFKTLDPGASPPVVVNREGVPTTVFPWVVARGEPGRVAVAFYGTPTDVPADAPQDPDATEDDRTWNVYVNQSLNALDDAPDFSQVQATTHPNHYGQICLLGIGCTTGGDRSLVDFFAIDMNPVTGELAVVFNRAHKRPSDGLGSVSTPVVVRQISGPSNAGGVVAVADREPLRQVSTDPTGDAIADFSSALDEPMLNYVAAADLTRVEILPPIDPSSGDPSEDGGFTVRLHLEDLSDAALQQALADAQAQSLIFMFRFVDGFRYESAQANWDPFQGFTFGHSEFGATVSECGAPPDGGTGQGDQCLTYFGETGIPGTVDQDAGTITMTVPLDLIEALDGLPAGPEEHPEEVPAEPGDRIYTAAAFVLSNASAPDDQVQSFLVPLDNAPAMDFLVPAAASQDGDDTGGEGGGGGDRDTDGGSMPATGGGLAVLALLTLAGASLLRRSG